MPNSASWDLDQAANRAQDSQQVQMTLHCGSWIKDVHHCPPDASHIFVEIAALLHRESNKGDPKLHRQSATNSEQRDAGPAGRRVSASFTGQKGIVNSRHQPTSAQNETIDHERDVHSRHTGNGSFDSHINANVDHPLLRWRSQASSEGPPYLPAGKASVEARGRGTNKRGTGRK